MSHHKKRVYPQAQLQYGQNATPLQQPAQFMPPQDPAAAGMSYGQMGMPPQGCSPFHGAATIPNPCSRTVTPAN